MPEKPVESVVTPAPAETTPAQPTNVQYVVQQQSLEGIGGWLIFWLIVFGLNALTALWMFILGLIGLVEANAEGLGLALLIEMMIFSILMAAASTSMVVFTAMRKKLGVLLAYVSLGVSALYTTTVCITVMIAGHEKCVYNYDTLDGYARTCSMEALPAGGIIALVGAILVTWLGAFLVGLYFKLSRRVKLTLTR